VHVLVEVLHIGVHDYSVRIERMYHWVWYG
jgi:hypothetical protein